MNFHQSGVVMGTSSVPAVIRVLTHVVVRAGCTLYLCVKSCVSYVPLFACYIS